MIFILQYYTHPHLLQEMPSPRGFKSHLKYNLMPGTEPAKSPAKYIYVYRNPKDTAVSGFFQAKSLVLPDITWEKYFDRFMSGQVGYGEMLDHVLGWWQHKGESLALCLHEGQGCHYLIKTEQSIKKKHTSQSLSVLLCLCAFGFS